MTRCGTSHSTTTMPIRTIQHSTSYSRYDQNGETRRTQSTSLDSPTVSPTQYAATIFSSLILLCALAKRWVAPQSGEQATWPFNSRDRRGRYTAEGIRKGHRRPHRPREWVIACLKSQTQLTIVQRNLGPTLSLRATALHPPSTPDLRTVSFTSTLQVVCAHLLTCVDQKYGEG